MKTGTENGMSVTYRASASVALQADAIVDLRLAKVVSRSVAMTWDASQRRLIPAGDSVTYTIDVRNTGNVADTFSFSGTPGDWQFSFTPSSVPLDFGSGATSTQVRVVVQSPANALVSHPSLHVVATSMADASQAGDVTVNVDIERVRALSVSLNSTGATFDGRFLNDTVRVTNGGNDREVVQVVITNAAELAAVGWSAGLGNVGEPLAGTTLTNVTVEANQSVPLRLRGLASGGPSGGPGERGDDLQSVHQRRTHELGELHGEMVHHRFRHDRGPPDRLEPEERFGHHAGVHAEPHGSFEGADHHARRDRVRAVRRDDREHDRRTGDRRRHTRRAECDLPGQRVDGRGKRDRAVLRGRPGRRDEDGRPDRPGQGRHGDLQLPPGRIAAGDPQRPRRSGPGRERRDCFGPRPR